MRYYRLLIAMTAVLCLWGCKSDDDATVPSASTEGSTVTLNVDVILPADIRSQWQNTIDWALTNIDAAQNGLQKRVKLNLRYHDEDTEDLDKLGYRLTTPEEGDDTCHAIIGPYHSENANHLLRYAAIPRLPVVMPTCSSAEMQRINARNTYAWFLTESDITQCEMMVAAAQSIQASDIVLIYSEDLYGRSFLDWFGYYATEQGVHVAGGGTLPYKRGVNLDAFLDETVAGATGDKLIVLVALSDVADIKDVNKQVVEYRERHFAENGINMMTICSDTSYDQTITADKERSHFQLGISPMGSNVNGFPQTYEGIYGQMPVNGEAQIYDALTIIALGAAHQITNGELCIVDGKQVEYDTKPYGPTLTDHMRAIVCTDEGMSVTWKKDGLTIAFREVAAGRTIDMVGATGDLVFGESSRTAILNTSYMFWQLKQEYLQDRGYYRSFAEPLIYISTAGSYSEVSIKEFWKLEKRWEQTFNDQPADTDPLPDATDCWAVVISPSTTWVNYRHQADAFAMYQLLRHHGYDDDHIVLIVEDNLAYHEYNKFPGEIYVERSSSTVPPSSAVGPTLVNDNVRKDAVVDYHFNDLTPDDIADIMLGCQSDRLPHVIHPTATSNVFFFWSGHGGMREGPLWGNEDTHSYFGTQRIKDIVSEMAGTAPASTSSSALSSVASAESRVSSSPRSYRRMMFAIETCYSGIWGEALTGQPQVLVLTAANPTESSKADVHDIDLGIYLSNAFARTFRNQVNLKPDITIYDLYRHLARTTIGSHVTIYNQANYGSVYTETMGDYFK